MFKALLLKQRSGSSCRHRSKFYSINPQIPPGVTSHLLWSSFVLSDCNRGQSLTHLIQTQWVREKEAKRVGGIKCREPISTFLLTRKELWGCTSLTGSHKHICEQHTQQPLNRGWSSPMTQACPLLGAGSGDAPPLAAHGAQITAGTQPLCQGRGPAMCLLVYLTMLPSSSSGRLRSPSARRRTGIGT